MTQSTDQLDKADEEFWKNRFKGYSQVEIDRIKAQDEEREAIEDYVNKQVELAVQEFPELASTKEKNDKLAKEKELREQKRWRKFHFFKD